MNITDILHTLAQRKHLSPEQAALLIDLLTGDTTSQVQIAAVLTALRVKGEVAEEIVGFIKGMRSKMLRIYAPDDALDVCGTGGDKSGTFNISTAVSFVVAASGVPVVKHGNRSASSLCGSADVLEALGVNIMLTPQQAEEVLKKVGMVFLFAPVFHPSFKQVGVVRKALGIPTIFNILGPLSNPGHVKRQLIGVPSLAVAKQLSEVATHLDYEHLCIISSEDGLDEVSLGAKTHVYEIKGKNIKEFVIDPQEYGFEKISKEELQGRGAALNAEILKDIMDGEKGAYRDIVVLNCAVALYVSEKVTSIQGGIPVAEKAIDSAKAKEVLESLKKETQKYA